MTGLHSRLRRMGAYRLFALYYPSTILGYPFVVLILGHTLHEGREFLIAHPELGFILLGIPIVLIAAHLAMIYLVDLTDNASKGSSHSE